MPHYISSIKIAQKIAISRATRTALRTDIHKRIVRRKQKCLLPIYYAAVKIESEYLHKKTQ